MIARVEKTCGGPKLYVFEVLTRTWIGTNHDELADELCYQINWAARNWEHIEKIAIETTAQDSF